MIGRDSLARLVVVGACYGRGASAAPMWEKSRQHLREPLLERSVLRVEIAFGIVLQPQPGHSVRRPFRSLLAAFVLLSVVLSTLGMTNARCPEMDQEQATHGAMAETGHRTRDDAPSRGREHCDHGPGAPEERSADTSCLLVGHCATVMITADRPLTPAMCGTSTSRIAGCASAPAARALEPDSPPPRG